MKTLNLIILALLVCSHCHGQNSNDQSYKAQKAKQKVAQINALQDSLKKEKLKNSIANAIKKNNGQCPAELSKSEEGRELCEWAKESKAKADSLKNEAGSVIPNGGRGKGVSNGKKPQPAKKKIPKEKKECIACKGYGWYGQSKNKKEASRHPATFSDPCNYCNGKGYY